MKVTLAKKLDLDILLEDVEKYTYSELSLRKFKELKYIKNFDKLVTVQKENEEVENLLRKYPGEFKLKIYDYYTALQKSKIDSMLIEKELHYILRNLEIFRLFKNKFEYIRNTDTENYEHIENYVTQIPVFNDLIEYLQKIIDEDGYIKSDASSELKEIKDKMKSLQSKADKTLRSIIRSNASKLTESIVTKRNDRYVILVKPEYKNDFGGIIHDQSASGNTFYIEPRENVIISNEISILSRKEKEEIFRILSEATEKIKENSLDLKIALDNFSEVEFIFSKINFSINKGLEKPIIRNEQVIDLKKAYNPLLDRDIVVKNDVLLNNYDNSLIITGPNTGGKTVILKTVGLAVLLTHLGLYIPAANKSVVGFFENIFIDIGDEQSIANNLSTFSSHMKNIVSILENTTDKSIVLLDELCSGTDPSEGAALSMAILNKFKELRTTVLCTTHYPEIKDYCFKSNYYKNSSLEFDFDTLKPTYKFVIGLPGKSNAINISYKIGLEESMIAEANTFLEETEKENSLLIDELSKDIKEYEDKIRRLNEEILEIRTIKDILTNNLNDFELYKHTLYEKANEELNKEIEEKKEEMYEVYKNFKNSSDSIKQHQFNEMIENMDANKVKVSNKKVFENTELDSRESISVGDDVVFLKYNQRAEVLEIKGMEVVIKLGSMKITAKLKDLRKIKKEKTKSRSVTISQKTVTKVGLDVNVIGENTESALRIIEDYLDKVLLSGYDTFTIIHGVGSGILKKNIAEYLKNNRYVAAYRSGGEGEGGLGVTIVEMK
ncbi:MAG: endonuclease MutS2 [Gemella sp.]|nr:endonuclease MutS2 [Gemella sp.]